MKLFRGERGSSGSGFSSSSQGRSITLLLNWIDGWWQVSEFTYQFQIQEMKWSTSSQQGRRRRRLKMKERKKKKWREKSWRNLSLQRRRNVGILTSFVTFCNVWGNDSNISSTAVKDGWWWGFQSERESNENALLFHIYHAQRDLCHAVTLIVTLLNACFASVSCRNAPSYFFICRVCYLPPSSCNPMCNTLRCSPVRI